MAYRNQVARRPESERLQGLVLVGLDGAGRQPKDRGDLLHRPPLGQQARDIPLPRRQRRTAWGDCRSWLLDVAKAQDPPRPKGRPGPIVATKAEVAGGLPRARRRADGGDPGA